MWMRPVGGVHLCVVVVFYSACYMCCMTSCDSCSLLAKLLVHCCRCVTCCAPRASVIGPFYERLGQRSCRPWRCHEPGPCVCL